MAKITLDNINDPALTGNTLRGSFTAETLTCTITRPCGEVVAELALEPRAFTPNEKSGKGGVGWYAPLKSRSEENYDGGEYRGVGVSGAIRLSLAGLKISAGDTVDLNPAVVDEPKRVAPGNFGNHGSDNQ